NLIEKISRLIEYNNFPIDELPNGYNTKQPKESHGITHVHQFYTIRNLFIASEFWRRLDWNNRWILTSFISRNATKLNRFVINKYNPNGRINGPLSATLYVPSLSVEQSIFILIEDKLRDIDWNTYGNIVEVSSASDLRINDESIDYIFIDPPFGANIMYSEVNYIWESWIKVKTNNKEEAIQNPTQDKDINSYKNLMIKGLKECYRVLKSGKWITIEFSNTQAAVWNVIQSVVQEAGFIISSVGVLDKKHGGIRAMTNPTSVKQDLVISAYKPNDAFKNELINNQNSILSIYYFLDYHLEKLPTFIGRNKEAELIVERTPKVLFDRVVAYHIQNGLSVPVSSAEFQEKVAQKYVMRDGMVFLESQVAEYDKKRILAKEFSQQSLFVSDESSAIEWLRQQLMKKPQSRQDLHPQFMKEIQHIAKHEELPELDKLLAENFLLYDSEDVVPDQIAAYLRKNYHDMRGLENQDDKLKSKAKNRWYVPDPNKQADLEKLREKSLLREFNHYVEEVSGTKKKLKLFRSEAIRAGFKQAWSEKDYQKIVDVAEYLPEKIIQEDDKLLMFHTHALMRLDI
ncbi:TPA: DNA methylase, partial [Enterococcus faecium]|nr:DNA methylase [Enterococcus faecium]